MTFAQFGYGRFPMLLFFFLLFCAVLVHTAAAVEISDSPMETQVRTAPANLMLIVDNSGDMDAELMTPDPAGFADGRCYLFPDSAYSPRSDHQKGGGNALSESQRRQWRLQWWGHNSVFYNPGRSYAPWPATPTHSFGHADLHRPWSSPLHTGAESPRLSLVKDFFSVGSDSATIVIATAHYFTVDDTNRNSRHDAGEAIYLVAWVDADGDGLLDLGGSGVDRRRYYRFDDDGDNVVEDGELIRVVDELEKNRVRPILRDARGEFEGYKTDDEDLQNFVNWCTYYRRRAFAAKAAAAEIIGGLTRMQVGLYALNGPPRMAVLPVNPTTNDGAGTDESDRLLDALYEMATLGGKNLRRALDDVGRYFSHARSSGLGDSPIAAESAGGACQHNFALIVTDGLYDGSYTGVGNADGNQGAPYADMWSNTLADVAMHYFQEDLAPGLPDLIPRKACDDATHQHMNTYTLSLARQGIIDREDADGDGRADQPCYAADPCYANPDTPNPRWPQPDPGSTATIDDLWHAAVNGRGVHFISTEAQPMLDAMHQAFSTMVQSSGAASLLIGDDELTGDTVVYQTVFDASDWTGDLKAYAYDAESGQVDTSASGLLWSAARQLERSSATPDSRRIVTYGGPWRQPQGIPFRYADLSDDQKTALGSDLNNNSLPDRTARKQLDYIRGEEEPSFRLRSQKLGDIVHASPLLEGATVYVGANDGMLHAFDAASGNERFAYVPHLVFNNLKALSANDYAGRHQFYVDAAPYAGSVVVDRFERNTLLVGGLGKGGQGYYCLLLERSRRTQNGTSFGPYVTTFSVDDLGPGSTEESIAAIVQWEYPRPDPADDFMDNDGDGQLDEPGEFDPDMGYSFGQGYAVNANTAADDVYRPVVIFPNGYNSRHGKAVLYIVDAADGTLIRKIDTGAGDDNGLSIPALIDVDLDRRVDYAYAGDLKGNLWKFDLTSGNPARWGVAYGEDRDADGVIDAHYGDFPEPLFRASGQSITGRPDVIFARSACAPLVSGFLVVFGTGRYLGMPDREDTSGQTIYGLWDFGDDGDDSEHLGYITNRDNGRLSSGLRLVPQQVVTRVTVDGTSYRQLSNELVNYSTGEDDGDADGIAVNNSGAVQHPDAVSDAGWFLDFPVAPDDEAEPGERVTANVVIRGGRAVVISFVPEETPCTSGGHSWVYLLNSCFNGFEKTIPTDIALLPRRYDGMITGSPVIAKDRGHPRDDQLMLSDTAGRIIQETFKGEVWGKVHWCQNILD
jgi:type IV pilus assembly protein PilY1